MNLYRINLNFLKYRNKEVFQASLFIAVSGILYGFLGLLGTLSIESGFSIATMLFWRFFIAGVWMSFFVIKRYITHRELQQIDKRALFFTFLLGALGYAGSSGFYFVASQYTGTGLAMVIFFSYPMFVAFASWVLYRYTISSVTILLLLMTFVGLFLLGNSSAHQFSKIGIVFGLLSAGCYVFYVLGSKQISSISLDTALLTTMVSFGCALIFLIISLLSHQFAFPHLLKNWASLLALAILSTALPIQFMLKGLQHVSSTRASIISVLEPLVTVLVGVVLLHESISPLQLTGVMIILVSILLIQFQKV